MKYFKKRVTTADDISIIEATSLVRNLSRLSGVMPYNVKVLPDNKVDFKLSWVGVVASATWTSLFVWCLYNAFLYQQTVLEVLFTSILGKNGEFIESCMSGVVVLYVCTSLFFSKQSKVQFWSNMLSIDNEIRALGLRVNNAKLKSRLQLASILHLTATSLQGFILFYILLSWSIEIPFNKIFQVAYSFNIIFHSQLQYCYCVHIMECRFRHLNKALRSVLGSESRSMSKNFITIEEVQRSREHISSSQEKRLLGKIIAVGKIYSKLHYIALETDTQFGNIIVLIVCLGFVSIILHIFYLMEATAGGLYQDVRRFWFFVGYNGQFIGGAIFVSYTIVTACDRVYKETTKLAGIAHNIIQEGISAEISNEASFLSLQLLHQKQKFTANGLFHLDKSLLLSLTGSVTTYLVILLQFATGSHIEFNDISAIHPSLENNASREN